jgi:t-SNARE complex subunit (syntaxin)
VNNDPPQTPRETAQKALREAEARGRESAELRGDVAEHERRFGRVEKRLDDSLNSLDRRLTDLIEKVECVDDKVDDLATAFETYVAVAKALAEQALATARKAVTTRTFIISFIMAVVAILAYLRASGIGA